ncbi:hypothetical protein EL469_14510 [Enterococcus faecalis]|nr:hypothetical protein [Enterococcus faecalis]EGO8814972.1 hypothetical protein [Enterococcus faecalis]EGO9029065.1 hypothetical protein [Enterococcus faecalis]EGO9234314.1 hypothetical protein [Enterococcus faecalis]
MKNQCVFLSVFRFFMAGRLNHRSKTTGKNSKKTPKLILCNKKATANTKKARNKIKTVSCMIVRPFDLVFSF